MTKNDFLCSFKSALEKNRVPDIDGILGEYEQHFTFKMSDGYSEEEVAARLGDPTALAGQYDNDHASSGRNKFFTVLGLIFSDIGGGCLMILLTAWLIVIAALSLVSLVGAVCLICGINICALLPSMPYGCAVIYGVMLAALSVLSAAGCIFYAAFLRQLLRAYLRFHHNALASASGRVPLPKAGINPQLDAKLNRRLRTTVLISLIAFSVCFILAFVASAFAAGGIQFWHLWGWFGYNNG